MSKMDTRIRELESELDAENRRQGDAQKNLRKSERRIKELTYQQDEDRKNHERMQALIDQLQGKIKSYKKQIEEAEEIAALNLAKYRQAQNNVVDAGDRAQTSEQALAKNRARARSASVGPVILRTLVFHSSSHTSLFRCKKMKPKRNCPWLKPFYQKKDYPLESVYYALNHPICFTLYCPLSLMKLAGEYNVPGLLVFPKPTL